MGLFSKEKHSNHSLLPPQPHSIPSTPKLPDPLPRPSTQVSPPSHIPKDDDLQLGIFYHEQDKLDWSAYHFSLAATSGNPLGLILYALSLRHGWVPPSHTNLNNQITLLITLYYSGREQQKMKSPHTTSSKTQPH
jgi:hypothetical protein